MKKTVMLALAVGGTIWMFGSVGCGKDETTTDAGTPADSGPADAGRPDAGRVDSGVVDSGVDAGSGSCNPVTNVGCVSGTTKCSVGFDEVNQEATLACQPTGSVALGVTCDPQVDDCAPGGMCLTSTAPGGASACEKVCAVVARNDRNGVCPDPGQGKFPYCLELSYLIDGATAPELDQFGYCANFDACSPLSATPCVSTKACMMLTNTPDFSCFTAGALTAGTTCAPTTLCVAGADCLKLQGDADYKCYQYCNTAGGTPACTTGTCTSLGATGDYANLGVCK